MTNLRKSIRMALACLYLLHCDSMDKFLPSAEMIFSGKSCNMESVPSLCIYSPLGRVPPNICFLPSVLTARYPGMHCAFLRHIGELCLPCLYLPPTTGKNTSAFLEKSYCPYSAHTFWMGLAPSPNLGLDTSSISGQSTFFPKLKSS